MPSALSETLPDSLEAQLVYGIAEQLAAWDIVAWSDPRDEDADPYTADTIRPTYLGPDEPATAPDERVLITAAPLVHITARTVEVPVGFNWRGPEDSDPLGGLSFTGMLYRRLHRYGPALFGTVRVGAVLFRSAGSIGRDHRRRPGATANYAFRGQLASVNQ